MRNLLKNILKNILIWFISILVFEAIFEFIIKIENTIGLSIVLYPIIYSIFNIIKNVRKYINKEFVYISPAYKILLNIFMVNNYKGENSIKSIPQIIYSQQVIKMITSIAEKKRIKTKYDI